MLEEGSVFRSMVRDDAYRVVRMLGEGPSGRTELVTLDGEELLVRKRIPAKLGNASAWASLMGQDIPGLPRIESLYQMPDELVVIYTYIEGVSVRELMDKEGALASQRAVPIVLDVCKAASGLHTHGIVHRDIAPGNVIVAQDGAYLVDLGIARQHVEGRNRDTTPLGTWGFAAPEQFGFAQTDERSDVYAIGKLLGYLLTGVSPDKEAYVEQLAVLAQESPSFASIIERATSFEPSARYQSADELADALREAQRITSQARSSASADMAAKHGTHIQKYSADTRTSYAHASGAAPYDTKEVPQGVEPLSFNELPALFRVLAIVFWTADVLWVLLVVGLGIKSVIAGDPPWGFGERSLGLVLCVATTLFCREIYGAMSRRDPYAKRTGARSVLLLLLARLLAIVAGVFCAFGLIVVIAVIADSIQAK